MWSDMMIIKASTIINIERDVKKACGLLIVHGARRHWLKGPVKISEHNVKIEDDEIVLEAGEQYVPVSICQLVFPPNEIIDCDPPHTTQLEFIPTE
ncbi:unnamed protein product [Caenorhabditis bovis]|uniref:Uncharacterized protein n=1 Tax=Caenorhabditis bovis TaxID=2654633 RepID=A0A8S1F9I7_9PELO|nr:unnamed protein product [Caenorhabditis bovis]